MKTKTDLIKTRKYKKKGKGKVYGEKYEINNKR